MTILISAGDLRKQTGLTSSVLNTLRKNGRGPKAVRIGREYFYNKAKIDYFEKAGHLEDGDMTEKTAAQHLGVGVSILKGMRKKGEGPAFRKIGNRIVYNAKDLENWTESAFA